MYYLSKSIGFNKFFFVGDNILTAISVARECDMIGQYHEIFILETVSLEDDPNCVPKLVLRNVGSTVGDSGVDFIIDFDKGVFYLFRCVFINSFRAELPFCYWWENLE